MIQTLIDILRREQGDLVERIQREERAPIPDSQRLQSLRDEAFHLRRQLDRLADR